MSIGRADLLLQALANPASIKQLSLAQWDLLIRQAHCSDLLGRLYAVLKQHGLLDSVPSQPFLHLQSAFLITERHRETVLYEVERIMEGLRSLQGPVLILKGAAYLVDGLPAADGRIFADIDILVRRQAVDEAERLLELKGWLTSHLDDYDQKYYRRWMHELPPLRHGKRQTEVDLHHAIVPVTARTPVDTDRLLEKKVSIAGYSNLYRLGNEDMILHSAVHLFNDGEFNHGLRDLEDIRSLLEHFYRDNSSAWEALLNRASELHLQRPLYYALYYCHKLLKLAVPEPVLAAARQSASAGSLKNYLLQKMFYRGLMPNHGSCRDAWTELALGCLYMRSHYLRMPLYLLLPHLLHKALITPIKSRRNARKAEQRLTLEKFLETQKQAQKKAD